MLSADYRGRIAEKIMELGNIAAGALLFGQAISGKFDLKLAIIGLITLGCLYGVAGYFMKGGGRK